MKPFKPVAIACAFLIGSSAFASTPDTPSSKLIEVPYGQTSRISSPAPRYPRKERETHVSGTAIVAATVAADGNVTEVKIVESQPVASFGVAAAEAVAQWKFGPKTKNGQQAPFVVNVPLYFMDATD